VPAEEIVSTYTFRECLTFLYLSDQFFCAALAFTEVSVVPFVPPFSYNYLCTSTLLSAYLPVYIYIYSLQALVYPLATYLLAKAVPFDQLPGWVRTKLPGILWPHHWLAESSPGGLGGDRGRHHDTESTMRTKEDKRELASAGTILKTDELMTKHLQGTLVLITFGLCCPPLALTISLSLFISLLQLRCLIGRFLLLRHPTLLDQTLTSPAAALPSADSALRALKSGIVNLDRSFHHTAWIVVWTSCFFFVLLCWDIAGDEVGWLRSLWVPGVAVGYLLSITLVVKWLRAPHASSSPSPHCSETGECGHPSNPIIEMITPSSEVWL
jgi:hypothetical protein